MCLGDASHLTYKRSFVGSSEVDRAASHVLTHSEEASEVIDFFPYGYDERQFNSPGFRLPVGSLNADAMDSSPSITPRPTTWNSSVPISLQSRFMRFAA